MLASDGRLYAWILSDGTAPVDVRLATSDDLSLSWIRSAWAFPGVAGGFYPLGFLNFGRDNTGTRDDFVYVYGKRWASGGDPYAGTDSYLARMPRTAIEDTSTYEYFAGLNEVGAPLWASDFGQAAAVISDPDGIDAPGVIYHSGLQRYIASTAHAGQIQKLAVYDAPEPWGPWTTVVYHDNWGGLGSWESLGYRVPLKWIDPSDGTLWMVFSAGGAVLDAFNLVPGRLVLRPGGALPGPAGTRLRNMARASSAGSLDPLSSNNSTSVEITVVP
jgi:hypothetical protein